jgi:hypothetical protein
MTKNDKKITYIKEYSHYKIRLEYRFFGEHAPGHRDSRTSTTE